MKIILLLIIKLYWHIIPASKRRRCIFRKSCSNYVYEHTINEGFKAGIRAFNFRYQNCRGTYEVFKNPLINELQVKLPNQQIIDKEEIAKSLIDEITKVI
ncbi:hypothetical protein GCM10022393_39200 [Aquimarina addita]|uniref:Membrane protein insertion efficiency factor YidD n=1 Tax=Aquimarina addita TaxID=870485 RepID=A0ABP6UVK5_9FLAO